MKQCVLYVLLLIGILVSSQADAVTITYRQGDGKGTVSDTDATYVNYWYKNTNYGSATKLTAAYNIKMLFRFPNIFGDGEYQIPVGSTINSANLSIWTNSGIDNGAGNHYALEVYVDWQENNVTWNNFGSVPGGHMGTDYQYFTSALLVFTSGYQANVERVIPITELVQDWCDETKNNYGILVKKYGSTSDWYSYWHSDDSTFNYRPLLTIDYTPPELPPSTVPEPTTIILLGISCLRLLRNKNKLK